VADKIKVSSRSRAVMEGYAEAARITALINQHWERISLLNLHAGGHDDETAEAWEQNVVKPDEQVRLSLAPQLETLPLESSEKGHSALTEFDRAEGEATPLGTSWIAQD
jgi:hypothetical protein